MKKLGIVLTSLLILALILGTIACSGGGEPSTVRIVDIMANPTSYIGKEVTVQGYANYVNGMLLIYDDTGTLAAKCNVVPPESGNKIRARLTMQMEQQGMVGSLPTFIVESWEYVGAKSTPVSKPATSFSMVKYTNEANGYSIPYPNGWRVEVTGGEDVAFFSQTDPDVGLSVIIDYFDEPELSTSEKFYHLYLLSYMQRTYPLYAELSASPVREQEKYPGYEEQYENYHSMFDAAITSFKITVAN
jgi:hypothetical protein